MTILNIIFAILGLAMIWSWYQDYKIRKEYQKALFDKKMLEDNLS